MYIASIQVTKASSMRLELLCDIDVTSRSTFGEMGLLQRPYGTEEGSAYGEFEGTVSGERLRGDVRLVNHPHGRSDGAFLPHAHGVIRTQDGAFVLFVASGLNAVTDQISRPMLSVMFESDDVRYKWLNDRFCVAELKVESERAVTHGRVYECHGDLV